MKRVLTGLVIIGLVGAVGCNKATGPTNRGTNTSASPTSASPTSGSHPSSDATFSVKGPLTSTTIKQGETKEVKVTVDKGKAFKEDITLEFIPEKGLTVDPKESTYKASDTSGPMVVKVTAAKDAPIGESHITVKSKPAGNDLKIPIKVEK